MIEIDPETMIDKVKILVKIGMEMIIEGMGTHKISVEIMADVEAEIFNRNYSSDRSRSRERRLSPRRYNNNNNRQNTNSRLWSESRRSSSRIRSNSRVRTNRDRIRCYRCREYDHYASECQNVVVNDSEGYDSDNAALEIIATEIESDVMRDIERYREDTEYLNL